MMSGSQNISSVKSVSDISSAEDLAQFGYGQELRRELGPFASFASGFSFVSILSTIFELFATGYGFGGPLFFWTWPIVFIGQFSTALCFAELAASYPVAGAVYQWSRRLSNDSIGWFAGWFMLIGYIMSVAAIAIAMQSVLPSVWSGFQIIGGDTAVGSPTGAANAVILGTATIFICALISSLGVRATATATAIGVYCEIIGLVILLVVLFTHTSRGPSVVMGGGVPAPTFWSFLSSTLMAAYVMYGFDSAAELSEETNNPRRTTPKAIIQCLLVSFFGGALMVMAALMAAPSLTDGNLAKDGVSYVLASVTSGFAGHILFAMVAISILSATLAIQNAAARVMFSMARDNRLPLSSFLTRVSARTATPWIATLAVTVMAISLLWVSYGDPAIFSALCSVTTVTIYFAYLLVTLPMLILRIKGINPVSGGMEYFYLGRRKGLFVNIVSVVIGILLLVNVAWPRLSVFDPGNTHWYLHYFPIIFMFLGSVSGLLVYKYKNKQNI
ncbi:MAG: amino acid permease [Acetobacter orientalis]|uniref:amino acid permease n=1 Tax=Acetobacter orientalis TaxID=146474 RepID=UPI0039EAFC29